MYTIFNSDTLITRFVKNFISATNIPMIKVLKDKMYVYKDSFYIWQNKIIKSLKNNDWNITKNSFDECFKVVDYFDVDKFYPGITTTFKSNSIAYDYKTHLYLGEYLRFYRDYYKIDLLPFYNCFGGRYLSKYIFDDNSNWVECSSNDYKLLVVPVKYEQEYLIAVNSSTPIEVLEGFCDDNGVLISYNQTADGNNIFKKTVINTDNFCKPFKYKTTDRKSIKDLSNELSSAEKYFSLFIKIPKSNNSSVVVIEYSLSSILKQAVNGEIVPTQIQTNNKIQNIVVDDEKIYSPLGLLQFSDGMEYAFSDRLVEYLLNGVITKDYAFNKSIESVQKACNKLSSTKAINSKEDSYATPNIYGVWDDSLNRFLFERMKNYGTRLTGKQFIDINGYVDKDTEKVIIGE